MQGARLADRHLFLGAGRWNKFVERHDVPALPPAARWAGMPSSERTVLMSYQPCSLASFPPARPADLELPTGQSRALLE